MQALKDKVIYIIGTGARKVSHLPSMIAEFTNDGADVYTMMSNMGREISGSGISEFKIPGNTVVQGYSREGESLPLEDLLLIAPCTFNTLNKIASGIADSYPLTIAATAIGAGRKVVLAPAMNDSLWYHPMTEESRKKIEQWGCSVIWPEITPDKITMAPIEKIADSVYHILKAVRFDSSQVEMTKEFDTLLKKNYTEFRDIGQELVDADLTRDTGGCISKRVKEGILVSATGTQVGSLSRDDLSLITKNEDGKIIWIGQKKPSSESPLFCELYKFIPDAQAIIHGHCPRVTYDPKMQIYSTPDYVRTGCFGEGKKLATLLKKNKGFAILKLHGEMASGSSLAESYNILKQKMEDAHER